MLENFDFPSGFFGEIEISTIEFAGKEGSFIASGGGLDLYDDIF